MHGIFLLFQTLLGREKLSRSEQAVERPLLSAVPHHRRQRQRELDTEKDRQTGTRENQRQTDRQTETRQNQPDRHRRESDRGR